jgi:hypothetical protein
MVPAPATRASPIAAMMTAFPKVTPANGAGQRPRQACGDACARQQIRLSGWRLKPLTQPSGLGDPDPDPDPDTDTDTDTEHSLGRPPKRLVKRGDLQQSGRVQTLGVSHASVSGERSASTCSMVMATLRDGSRPMLSVSRYLCLRCRLGGPPIRRRGSCISDGGQLRIRKLVPALAKLGSEGSPADHLPVHAPRFEDLHGVLKD